ncbi:DUF3987 domain-containing protein [Flavicella sediminum]|uniref:DUF3987 domain-containing protein n=1 Tax=Flavicella sediminum TaxID=2585141 RepID=UPI00111E3020|nr:DUF3987 domain-containing protein [Flavicella sediminum]
MDINKIKEIKDSLKEFHATDSSKASGCFDKIIDLLPKEFTFLLEESHKHKRIPKEFMLSSMLFAVSSSIGTTFYIEELGFKNYGNLYFAIIGSRGDAKSEAIKVATKKLKELDDVYYQNYREELTSYNKEEGQEPKRKHLLVKDATIEAVQRIHFDNPKSLGICQDELFTLIDKMGNPNSRDGVKYRELFLEGYNNSSIDVARIGSESFRMTESYPTLIGGIQTQFIDKIFGKGNLESGFVDRLLVVFPSTKNLVLSRGSISEKAIENYNTCLGTILSYKNQSEKEDEPKKEFQIEFSDQAKDRLFQYVQGLVSAQEKAKPIIEEYMSKMQISIHKLCIVCYMMKNSSEGTFASKLNIETVELAILLNEFYFLNFNMLLAKRTQVHKELLPLDEIVKLAIKNNAEQKAVAEITGKDKGSISRRFKKVRLEMQLATRK